MCEKCCCHYHIKIQVKNHEISRAGSYLASAFIFFTIVENQVIFIYVILNVKINGSKKRNHRDDYTKKQAVNKNNQTEALIIS